MTLYEIDSQLKIALEQAEEFAAEHGGEIPDSLAVVLDSLELDKANKIGNIARLIKNETAISEVIHNERRSLDARQKAHDRKVEWLKNYLASFIPAGDKFEDGACKISWRSSEGVVLSDESLIPDQFVTITTARKISLLDVKEALKAGEAVPGARIEKRNNIQIK